MLFRNCLISNFFPEYCRYFTGANVTLTDRQGTGLSEKGKKECLNSFSTNTFFYYFNEHCM